MSFPPRTLVAALVAGSLAGSLTDCGRRQGQGPAASGAGTATSAANLNQPVMKTEAEWKQTLTPEQFRVLRQKGTERAFTGRYWNHHEPGRYRCAGCGQVLFASDAKFDSGCGWPSFTAPAATRQVTSREDRSHSMERTEVLCAGCGGHLGHVFPDGPAPTGLRYCINSVSLEFEPAQGAARAGEQAAEDAAGSPADLPPEDAASSAP
jgi:peptide-methionine (R)-S-oxide reductase